MLIKIETNEQGDMNFDANLILSTVFINDKNGMNDIKESTIIHNPDFKKSMLKISKIDIKTVQAPPYPLNKETSSGISVIFTLLE